MGATRPAYFPPNHPSVQRVVGQLLSFDELVDTLLAIWDQRVTHPLRY